MNDDVIIVASEDDMEDDSSKKSYQKYKNKKTAYTKTDQNRLKVIDESGIFV